MYPATVDWLTFYFHTFYDFCVNRDDSHSKILSKAPRYNASTPFGVFRADATKFVESSKNDQTFFCFYLSLPYVKAKLPENFNNSYDTFKKSYLEQ